VGHGSLYMSATPPSPPSPKSLVSSFPLSKTHLEAMKRRFRKGGYTSIQIDGADEVTGAYRAFLDLYQERDMRRWKSAGNV
jgi:hypothetical protein